MTPRYLTPAQRDVFREFGVPVRYARQSAGPKPDRCQWCSKPETRDNPLQVAHRVPYKAGVLAGLHPTWLNRSENLIWAHRRECNKAAELPIPAPA